MRLLITIIFLSISSCLLAQPSSSKLIKQGVILHDQGKYMDAISCYQQALRVNPSSISAMYEMSLSYLKMKDYDNAIIHSSKVINLGYKPTLLDAYVVKGTALAAQEKLDEAIALFKEAIKSCGDQYLLNYNLGLSYYNKGDMESALIHLRKALEKEATHAEGFLLYAYVLNDLGHWIESFYAYHFFLLLEPNTQRSVDVFKEIYDLLDWNLADDDPRLTKIGVVDRKAIYDKVQSYKPRLADLSSKYKFFAEGSQAIFTEMTNLSQADSKEFVWSFFVPFYAEILESGHFPTYCRYISASCFPESHSWWESNKKAVDSFINWFEHGEIVPVKNDEHADSED